jgi:hypothetical protein
MSNEEKKVVGFPEVRRIASDERIGLPQAKLITLKASSYTARGITWMWPNRFAVGKLGLIGGLPDKGKGLIGCDICACVTNKQPLPCAEGSAPQGSVLYFTAEDDIEIPSYRG